MKKKGIISLLIFIMRKVRHFFTIVISLCIYGLEYNNIGKSIIISFCDIVMRISGHNCTHTNRETVPPKTLFQDSD